MDTLDSPHHLLVGDPAGPAQACSGACDWVTALVRTHRAAMLAKARRLGLPADHAFDCMQEAFHALLRLPHARAVAADPEASGRLLSAMLRNAARTIRRRNEVARRRGEGAPEAVDALGADEPAADEQIARAEQVAQLRVCVAGLNATQRAVVTLRMLEERSGEDVAAALGLSPQHVAVLLHRAKASLRGCMAAANHAPEEAGAR